MLKFVSYQFVVDRYFIIRVHVVSFVYSPLELPKSAIALAQDRDFELAGYSMKTLALPEQTRTPRLVRVGAIQNQIVLPTDKPIVEQVD